MIKRPVEAMKRRIRRYHDSDLFSGKWVFDKNSTSLYSGLNCSFMDEGMACEKFGRKNLNYKYWRWQPHHCELPRSLSLSLKHIHILK